MAGWNTTVDGWNPANQLRLVVFPIIYRVSAPSQAVGNGISAINSTTVVSFLGKAYFQVLTAVRLGFSGRWIDALGRNTVVQRRRPAASLLVTSVKTARDLGNSPVTNTRDLALEEPEATNPLLLKVHNGSCNLEMGRMIICRRPSKIRTFQSDAFLDQLQQSTGSRFLYYRSQHPQKQETLKLGSNGAKWGLQSSSRFADAFWDTFSSLENSHGLVHVATDVFLYNFLCCIRGCRVSSGQSWHCHTCRMIRQCLSSIQKIWANWELLPAQETTKVFEKKVLPSLSKLLVSSKFMQRFICHSQAKWRIDDAFTHWELLLNHLLVIHFHLQNLREFSIRIEHLGAADSGFWESANLCARSFLKPIGATCAEIAVGLCERM